MRHVAVMMLTAYLVLARVAPGEALDATGMDWAGLGRDTVYVLGYEFAVGVPLCQRPPIESHSGSPIWSQCGRVTGSQTRT
jgi:hypothetical protein